MTAPELPVAFPTPPAASLPGGEVGRGVDTAAVLNVGCSHISCVWAEFPQDTPDRLPRVSVAEETPGFGIRGGAVADLRRATEAVRTAVQETRRTAGVPFRAAAVCFSGRVKLTTSRAAEKVRALDNRVVAADVRRVRALLPKTPDGGRTAVHCFEGHFVVGTLPEVERPVGLHGSRLETERSFVSMESDKLATLLRTVRGAGVRPELLALDPVASSLGATTDDERDLGTAVLDFGAGGLRAAFWEKGTLRQLHVAGEETAHLSRTVLAADGGMSAVVAGVAQRFRLPPATAEKIIIRHGFVGRAEAAPQTPETLSATALDGRTTVRFSSLELAEVLEELLRPALRSLRDGVSLFSPAHAGGVVLVGGGARLRGLAQLVSRHFGGVPVRVGIPYWEVCCDLPPALRGPGGCTMAGLVRLVAEKRNGEEKTVLRRLWKNLAVGFQRLSASFC